jgi:hypothetical protein
MFDLDDSGERGLSVLFIGTMISDFDLVIRRDSCLVVFEVILREFQIVRPRCSRAFRFFSGKPLLYGGDIFEFGSLASLLMAEFIELKSKPHLISYCLTDSFRVFFKVLRIIRQPSFLLRAKPVSFQDSRMGILHTTIFFYFNFDLI